MEKRRLLCLAAAVMTLASCSVGVRQRAASHPPTPANPPTELALRSFEHIVRPPPPDPPDTVDILIARAEEQYEAGLDDYRAGNFDKARLEFDRAVAMLLESNLDLLSDARLKDEFDRLVENIHSLEVVAVERGDVLSEQKYEPAAIESFAGLTFPVDPKVSQRVQDELRTVRSDLPLVSNDIVNGVIAYLQGRGSGFMKVVLKRIDLYRPLFEEILKREGVPQDLIYLAAAESTLNPFALSRAGAKGLWQLMLSRAIEYGLRKDRWVDEREDPLKSTRAAARHLKDLYQMFGDWYLAMAAYNGGPVAVQKAIEKTGYADFWMLHQLRALPTETENYVPIIIATALIAKDPQAYGFEVEPDPPIVTDRVAIGAPTDLRLVAQLIDRPVEEIVRLNPGLLRWTTPANDPEYVLRLPEGTGEAFEAAIVAFPPDKRIWWRAHKVSEGDTLASVARKFRISTVALASANNLAPGDPLTDGTQLMLPMAPGSEASLARVRERGSGRPIRYRIRRGDTLERIADRFDVTPYKIRRWNGLSSSRIIAGRTLRIYVAGGASASLQRARPRPSTSSASGSKTKRKATSTKSATGDLAKPRSAPMPSQPASGAAR